MSPFKILIFFIFLSIIGVFLIPRFSVDLNPSQNLPKLTITYTLPNASSEIVEQEATAPLENSFSQITGIKKIYSVSSQGEGMVEITFNRHVNLDFKKFEVLSLIRQLYPKLHSHLTYPVVEQRERDDDSKKPLLLYQVNSNLAPFQIRKVIQDTFVREISQLSGVNDVKLSGTEGLQITIAYDYQKLKLYTLSPEIITKAIREQFSSFYPGSFYTSAGQKLLIKAEHPFHDITELQNLRLPIHQNLRIKDIAEVFVEESKPTQYFRINGLNSITLAIYADDNINRLNVAAHLKESVSEVSKNLPAGYNLQLEYDDTEFLTKELQKNYVRSGLAILILVLVMAISYRRWKYLLILFSGVVVNLCLTALVAYFLGINIHLYTIAGITISFGMMMDNAIIMVDHLYLKRNSKIFRAIIGATMTTIMALLLVLFLPEEERHNLTEFCTIVAIALSCSIWVAAFYIPAVYKLTFDEPPSKRNSLVVLSLRHKAKLFSLYFSTISFIAHHRKIFISLLTILFGLPFFMLPTKWEGHPWYNKTLGSKLYQEEIRPYSDKIFGGSLRLFVRDVYDRSGYREPQRPQLFVDASLPFGNTLEEMNRIMQNIERELKDVKGIDKYITQVWSGEEANITIMFRKETERGSLPYTLKSKLISRSLDWDGVQWNIFGVGQDFNNNNGESLPKFKVELRGYNYDELSLQSEKLAEKLLRHKRIQKVNTNERLSWSEKSSKHYVLDFHWQQAGSLGILPEQVVSALQQKGNQDISQLSLMVENTNMPVFIKSDAASSFSTFDVMENAFPAGDKKLKLANYATLKLDQTSSSIHKEDRQYIRAVAFDYSGSHKFGNDYLDLTLEEMKEEMPVGYSAKKVSWGWDWEKAKRQYGLLIVLIVCIFCICAILFENLRQPFYVITTIPVSFIGVFLTFSSFDFYFDQGGYAAFVLLGGLVVNASIFILNDFNNILVIKNYNRSLVKAVTGKLKPIMLTTLSTCLGLVPFIIGGQNEIFWFAFSVGTIGGLIFSLLAIVFLLPVVIYKKDKVAVNKFSC